MINVFITEKALRKIAPLPRWNIILKSCSEINIDLDIEGLDKYLMCEDEDDPDYFYLEPVIQLSKDGDITLKPSKNIIDEIKNDNSKVLETPSAIFILDVDIEVANKIQSEYGVICISDNDCDLNDNKLSDFREIISVKGEKDHNWNEFLIKIKDSPTNSIIISDRYIFANDQPGEYSEKNCPGITNIRNIVDSILPLHFSETSTYDILIVFSWEPKDNGKCKIPFQKLSKKLYHIIKDLRPYNIKVEVLSLPYYSNGYDKTHNRRVITNYHVLRVEHNLKAFMARMSTTTQTMNWDMLFAKGINDGNDVPYKNQKILINDLKEIDDFGKSNPISCKYQYSIDGTTTKNPSDTNEIIFIPLQNRLIRNK